ncbi:MAG: multicopper oxidase type 3 [Acidobacteria bacterium]|nr:multicopper oxidase type 3 [Acidobacteriota bacterium]
MGRLLILLVCAVLITGAFILSNFIGSSKAQIISATDINPDPNIFEAYLTAQEQDVTIAGQTVHAMVYKDDPPLPFTSSGAGIPAPEIKVKVGENVIIHFKNNLPSASASIHWHGIELDNDSDGTAVTQDAVLAGQSYTYRFKTFRPGLFWYHSHMAPSNATFGGMYGPIVIENNIEPSLKGTVLPLDADTHNLVLSDIDYDANGKVGKDFNNTTTTINELIELCHLDAEGQPGGDRNACSILAGSTVLVNGENPNATAGAQSPKFVVPSGKRIRLRLFDASLSRHFRLKLLNSGDNKLYRIGGEGGLLDRVKVEGGTQGSWNTFYDLGEVVLGSGDRADVIVVPSGPQGSIVSLVGNSLPGPPFLGDTAYPVNYPIAFFEISGTSADTSPAEGDPILANTAEDIQNIKATPVNRLISPAPFGGSSDLTIRTTNSRPSATPLPSIDGYSAMLDSNVGNGDFLTIGRPPTARYAHVGETLELSVRNSTLAAHPFHMHGFSMQPVRIVDNNSGNTLFTWNYDEFIDTIDVYGGQTLVYRIRIDDRPKSCDQSGGPPGPVLAPCTDALTGGALGRWVYHCHIFHHAGLGMMSEVTILPGAPSAAPAAIRGHVADAFGSPISGVVVALSGGSQTRGAITNSAGVYSFAGVDTNSFYTVAPERANYLFSPNQRSFSLLANVTDATFIALPDAVPVLNPLDTSGFFVRQQYLDFLNREPDEAGFNFWVRNIESCGAETACIERRRIDVSAAFFLSTEFQQTGGLVDGLYRASFDRRPLYAEFMPDVRQLVTNKTAFVDAFVNRAAFHTAFDSMSNDMYVDSLITHTRVDFSASERRALVDGLTGGTLTRSRALQRITENQQFINARRNEAFVMMEYFGYLRRDPDESGYRFWLDKMNRFAGDSQDAEMVRAFLLSDEYRRRVAR